MAHHFLSLQVLLNVRPQMVQKAVFHFLAHLRGNLIVIPDAQKYLCILTVLPGQDLFQFYRKAFRCLHSGNVRFRLFCILFPLPDIPCIFILPQRTVGIVLGNLPPDTFFCQFSFQFFDSGI